MKSIARRVSDGRMPGLIKAWLEMPVEEDDGKGGKPSFRAMRFDVVKRFPVHPGSAAIKANPAPPVRLP